MKPKVALPCSRAYCVCIHGQRKVPHIFPAYFTKISFNIIKLSIHRQSQVLLSMRAVQPETCKNFCFSCVCHICCLSWISSPLWNVWGLRIKALLKHFFFQICCYFLGPDIFISTDFNFQNDSCMYTQLCLHLMTFIPYYTQNSILCWFCTSGLTRQLVPLNQRYGLLLHLFSMNVVWPSKF